MQVQSLTDSCWNLQLNRPLSSGNHLVNLTTQTTYGYLCRTQESLPSRSQTLIRFFSHQEGIPEGWEKIPLTSLFEYSTLVLSSPTASPFASSIARSILIMTKRKEEKVAFLANRVAHFAANFFRALAVVVTLASIWEEERNLTLFGLFAFVLFSLAVVKIEELQAELEGLKRIQHDISDANQKTHHFINEFLSRAIPILNNNAFDPVKILSDRRGDTLKSPSEISVDELLPESNCFIPFAKIKIAIGSTIQELNRNLLVNSGNLAEVVEELNLSSFSTIWREAFMELFSGNLIPDIHLLDKLQKELTDQNSHQTHAWFDSLNFKHGFEIFLEPDLEVRLTKDANYPEKEIALIKATVPIKLKSFAEQPLAEGEKTIYPVRAGLRYELEFSLSYDQKSLTDTVFKRTLEF